MQWPYVGPPPIVASMFTNYLFLHTQPTTPDSSMVHPSEISASIHNHDLIITVVPPKQGNIQARKPEAKQMKS
jgi:hypothetical protein